MGTSGQFIALFINSAVLRFSQDARLQRQYQHYMAERPKELEGLDEELLFQALPPEAKKALAPMKKVLDEMKKEGKKVKGPAGSPGLLTSPKGFSMLLSGPLPLLLLIFLPFLLLLVLFIIRKRKRKSKQIVGRRKLKRTRRV